MSTLSQPSMPTALWNCHHLLQTLKDLLTDSNYSYTLVIHTAYGTKHVYLLKRLIICVTQLVRELEVVGVGRLWKAVRFREWRRGPPSFSLLPVKVSQPAGLGSEGFWVWKKIFLFLWDLPCRPVWKQVSCLQLFLLNPASSLSVHTTDTFRRG